MGDGSETELGWRECFAGYRGDPDEPSAILLKQNNLHIEILIGEGFYIGQGDLANIYDLPRFLQYDILSNMDELVPLEKKEKRLEIFPASTT